MRELKKETKLIIGIGLTVVLLAVIAVIVILAVAASRKGTQLLSLSYSWVETNKDGRVDIYDGRFVAQIDGAYALVNDNRVISKKYGSLILADGDKLIYRFLTDGGEGGYIDRDGNETERVAVNGDLIFDTDGYTDFSFTYARQNGRAQARLGDKKSAGYDVVFRNSEVKPFGEIDQTDLTDVIPRFSGGTPAGVFFARNGTGDAATYYVSSLSGANERVLELAKSNSVKPIEKLTAEFITLNDGQNNFTTYLLPSLEQVAELNGVDPDKIYSKNGLIAADKGGEVLFVTGGGAKTAAGKNGADAITEFKAAAQNRALLAYSGSGYGYFDGSVLSRIADVGALRTTDGELFRLGDKILNAELKNVLPDVAAAELEYIADDKREYYIVKPSGGGELSSLYVYDGSTLIKKLDGVSHTYGDKDFFIGEYGYKNGGARREYGLYFISGGKIYDAELNVIGEGDSLPAPGVLYKDGIYSDLSGKRTIGGVTVTYPVYAHADLMYERDAGGAFVSFVKPDTENKYTKTSGVIFQKADGVYSFDERLVASSAMAEGEKVEFAYLTDQGALVVVTDRAMYCGDDSVATQNYEAAYPFGSGLYACATKSRIDVFRAAKRGFEKTASYSASAVTITAVSKSNVVFADGGGRASLIDAGGKIAVSPRYDGILLYGEYAVLRLKNLCAVASLKGRPVTDFKYVFESVVPLGGFAMGITTGGGTELINSKGSSVAKNVAYGRLESNNYIKRGGVWARDPNVRYYFIAADGVYRMIKEVN
ncbi:MAG: hypothetical protein LBP26_07880 [Clostridiales bacterium]|jgi:hypothetical protein|nr:hypothetical protein [Clostridiales bacterium]